MLQSSNETANRIKVASAEILVMSITTTEQVMLQRFDILSICIRTNEDRYYFGLFLYRCLVFFFYSHLNPISNSLVSFLVFSNIYHRKKLTGNKIAENKINDQYEMFDGKIKFSDCKVTWIEIETREREIESGWNLRNCLSEYIDLKLGIFEFICNKIAIG